MKLKFYLESLLLNDFDRGYDEKPSLMTIETAVALISFNHTWTTNKHHGNKVERIASLDRILVRLLLLFLFVLTDEIEVLS